MNFLENQFKTLSNGVKTCLVKTNEDNIESHDIEHLSISITLAFFLLMGSSLNNGSFNDVDKNTKAIDKLVDTLLYF